METMKQEGRKRAKRVGRRAAAAAAGVLTAASLTAGALFDSADEILRPAEAEQTGPESAIAAQKQPGVQKPARLPFKERLRTFLLAQNGFVRGAVLLPLWAAGRALITLCTPLISALSPYVGILVSVLLNALLLLAVFLFGYHALFPDRSVKELFKKGRWLYFLLGAVVLAAADAALARYAPQYRAFSLFVKLFSGLVVLACLGARLMTRRMRVPAAKGA